MSTGPRARWSAPICLLLLLSSLLAEAQTPVNQTPFHLTSARIQVPDEPASLDLLPRLPDEPQPTVSSNDDANRHGFIVRNLKRGLQDQKSLYLAPFKPKNIKWDIGFLAVTAGLLAVDRQTMRNIGTQHVDLSHSVALAALLGTSAVAGGTWAYGLKTGDRHADETGELTLESLANTFLIYTPMQFIAGRERPDEGTGNGRFRQHSNFNTSFPAGHPMFTWAMATMVAHEYPKPWVKILMYGAASTVSVARLTGRNHFPSDIWVGSVLGYLISSHIFHMRCDPTLSEACHRGQ
jgi:membrane-associated phospholipid phosphatase